ncbi:MAG: GFA family protein [Alphaproteobacteria bacterium]|nr:GFA family protein [Alphaproteobacteria bacterium]
MPRLEGSCECKAVTFAVDSHTRYPFMRCYCSICRKSAGAGGYAINLMGDAATLTVEGTENITVWQATIATESGTEKSPARRNFCAKCGSALWVEDPRWPAWVYPIAGAIDSELPVPPQTVHMMVASKASWVEVAAGPSDSQYDGYPEESVVDWHRTRGLYED